MFRALWSAASGMIAQQSNIDNISNNLANVNTTGFKKSNLEFQDLLYANLRDPGTLSADRQSMPEGLQLGTGVRAAGTRVDMTSGSLQQTDNTFDLALTDESFFEILLPNGTKAYTRDGSFKVNSEGTLVTTDGYRVGIQSNSNSDLAITNTDDVSVATNGSIIMPTTTDIDAEIYVLQDGGSLVEGPTGFYTGDVEQWTKGDPPDDVPPSDKLFKVELPDGTEAYTKSDVFKVDSDGNIVTVATAANSDGEQKPAKLVSAEMPTVNDKVTQVSVNSDGKFVLLQEAGRINLVTFTNPLGLEKKGQNLYLATAASGPAKAVDSNEESVMSGFLEASNVQVAEEMVKMIVAQRAYELNSKAITTTDEMMGIANNLKR